MLRGISELVAAALLALIAVTAGALVLMKATSYMQFEYQTLRNRLMRSELSAAQVARVAAAYVDSTNKLHVFIITGLNPVTINDVYINGTLYDDRCIVSYGGSTTGSLPNALVPAYTIVHLQCSLQSPGAVVVKIVYGGGSLVAYASPI